MSAESPLCAPTGTPQSGACFDQQALIGDNERLRTFGRLRTRGPAPWSGFSSTGFTEFAFTPAGLHIDHSHGLDANVSFEGLPHPIPKEEDASDEWCAGLEGKGWGVPLASTTLPDGSFLAASTVCFGSTRTSYNPSVSARSLVAWRSIDGGANWRYVGTIVAAEGVVPHDSTAGPSGEVDLAVMADNRTIMAVIRMDGERNCHCTGAVGTDACGKYRPYYAAYSPDAGVSWSQATPLAGTGCVRPRLLSLGPGAPMLLAGGRLCSEKTAGLYLWVNAAGLPGAVWRRYSVSYHHNVLWAGAASLRFSERVNDI